MPNKPFILLCVSIIFNFQFSIFNSLHAQELPLSDRATASVITCGPGNDFYTTFGHSALRITDSVNGIDWVYNYGTFDFNTPHFYWKFTQGRLNYCLSRETFGGFIKVYGYEGRSVWEQRLNLTTQEINNLYVALEWNYLPENRYYRYDFFRDNCATRVRDMVKSAAVHRDMEYLWFNDSTLSYRNLIASCLEDTLEWWRLGIDLLFGLPADHRCSTEESMFLPEEMMSRLGIAFLVRRDVSVDILTNMAELLVTETRPPLHRSFPPFVVFSLLFLAVALLSSSCAKRHKKLKSSILVFTDRLLFILAGLVGLFLIFMWVGTDHYCTAWNLNILWASPLLILIAIRLKRSPRWALWLQEGCFFVAAMYVVVCGLSPALLPIILTLALRIAIYLNGGGRR